MGPSRSNRSSRAKNPAVKFSNQRAFFVFAIFLVVAVIVVLRLFALQVVLADEYSEQARAARTTNIDTTPRRGTIYDRNGNVLAISVDATTIYVNPSELENADDAAKRIVSVLGGEEKDYMDALTAENTTFAYIKKKVDTDIAVKLKEFDIKGIYFLDDTRRDYPYGEVAGQVIGMVSDVEQEDGTIAEQGISGLELFYDDLLAGTSGVYIAQTGLDGTPIPGGIIEQIPAVDGQDIMISIDIELQEVVEANLKETYNRLDASSSSSIIMDASTGEIYAAASLPLFNPADPSSYEEGADQVKPITQAFEPGSIFKTIAAMAILELGTMEPEDSIYCPASIDADGFRVSDAHERGGQKMTLREILDRSSNVGISLATEELGFKVYYNKILQYQVTDATGVDYPGEGASYLADQSDWLKIQAYNITFGQGVTVTPLQLTRFYGALCNDGVAQTPHFLVSKLQTGEKPVYKSATIIKDEDALLKIKDMLHTVVTDGTGTLANISGLTICGKTSTAEIPDEEGGYKEDEYNLGFVGFVDNATSQLVCFVGASDVPYESSVTRTFKAIMNYAVDRYHISSISD